MGTLVFLKDDTDIQHHLEELVEQDKRFGFSDQNDVFIRAATAEEIVELVEQGVRLGGIFSQAYVRREDVSTVRRYVFNQHGVEVRSKVPAAFEGLRFCIWPNDASLISLSGRISWMVREVLKPVDNTRTDSFYDRHRGLI